MGILILMLVVFGVIGYIAFEGDTGKVDTRGSLSDWKKVMKERYRW